MKKVLALVLALSAGSVVAAQKVAPKAWPQEPSGFMGLTFESSSILALPPCTPGVIGFQQKQLCREPVYGANYYPIEGKPSIGLSYNYQLAATINGSQVESFFLSANTKDFNQLSQLFITKYGEPTARLSPAAQTKGGASFANDTLIWDGAKVKIILQRFSNDINTCAAYILNKPAGEDAARAGQDSVKKDASKL